MQIYIELNIDVTMNPEAQLLAHEGDIEGVLRLCASQLGETRQMQLTTLREGGEIRSGVVKADKKPGPCKVYRLGSVEVAEYIRELSK